MENRQSTTQSPFGLKSDEEGGECCNRGKCAERTRKRAEPGDDGHDCAEADGAESVAGHGVQVLSARQAVEAHNEGVVQEEHDCGEVPCPFLAPEEHLTDVTDVFDFGMSHAELPD